MAVYEPSTEKEGKSIISIKSFAVEDAAPDFVGLCIESKGGRRDYIFSSIAADEVRYHDKVVKGTYGLISEQGDDFTLFLGNGYKIAAREFSIDCAEKANVTLERKGGRYFYTSDRTIKLTFRNKIIQLEASDYKQITL